MKDEMVEVWFIDETGILRLGTTSKLHLEKQHLSGYVHVFQDGVPHLVEKYKIHDIDFDVAQRITSAIHEQQKMIDDLNKQMQSAKKRMKSLKNMLKHQNELEKRIGEDK